MLLTISDVLSQAQQSEARELLGTIAWRDGAETAGPTAKAVKLNEQADLTSRTGAKLRGLLQSAIEAHPVLVAAAQPRQFSPLIVSRTGEGGGYGLHVDNPFMGRGEARIRTDLSFTLFLSDPGDYEGGVLEIEHAGLTQALKPAAGDLVLYPSTSLHRVTPVTRGRRFVCVGWIESNVADPRGREVLFDLENLRASLMGKYDRQSAEMLTLSKTIANLLRMWG